MEARLAEILATPVGSRPPQAVQSLLQATEHTAVFRHLATLHDSDLVHRNCCQRMQWKCFRDGEAVLSYGETPGALCWIVAGVASAFAPPQVVATHQLNIPNTNIHQRTLAPPPEVAGQQPAIKETQYQLGLLQAFFQKEIDEAGTFANDEALVEAPHLAKQYCYGELGLVAALPSVSSLVAVSNVAAIVLPAADFYAALSEALEAECTRKVTDLAKVAVFRTWAKSTLVKLSEFVHVKRFRRNEIVFAENDLVDSVYFIRSGEFQVRIIQLMLRVGSPRKLTANLSIKSAFDILGADEVLDRRKTRAVTCKCYSAKGEVYFMKREVTFRQHFTEKVLNRPDTQHLLRTRHSLHLKSVNQRTQQVHEVENLKQSLELPPPRPTTVPKEWVPYIRMALSPKKLPPKEKEVVRIYEASIHTRRRTTFEGSPRTEPAKFVPAAEFIQKHFKRRPAAKPLSRRVAPPNFLLGQRQKKNHLYTRLLVFENLVLDPTY